jgi:hypothetical protein
MLVLRPQKFGFIGRQIDHSLKEIWILDCEDMDVITDANPNAKAE